MGGIFLRRITKINGGRENQRDRDVFCPRVLAAYTVRLDRYLPRALSPLGHKPSPDTGLERSMANGQADRNVRTIGTTNHVLFRQTCAEYE